MRILVTAVALFATALPALAQQNAINIVSGRAIDEEAGAIPLPGVTAVIETITDSLLVSGSTSQRRWLLRYRSTRAWRV